MRPGPAEGPRGKAAAPSAPAALGGPLPFPRPHPRPQKPPHSRQHPTSGLAPAPKEPWAQRRPLRASVAGEAVARDGTGLGVHRLRRGFGTVTRPASSAASADLLGRDTTWAG